MCYTMTLSTDLTVIPPKLILGLKGLSRVIHIILPTCWFELHKYYYYYYYYGNKAVL